MLDQRQFQRIKQAIQPFDIQYIEIESELLDHIATHLEDQLSHPNFEFETALNEHLSHFSNVNFQHWQKSKENQLSTLYYHQVWKLAADFFKKPIILITLMSSTIFFFYLLKGKLFIWIGLLGLILVGTLGYYLFKQSFSITRNGLGNYNSLTIKVIEKIKSRTGLWFFAFYPILGYEYIFNYLENETLSLIIFSLLFNASGFIAYFLLFDMEDYFNTEIESRIKYVS